MPHLQLSSSAVRHGAPSLVRPTSLRSRTGARPTAQFDGLASAQLLEVLFFIVATVLATTGLLAAVGLIVNVLWLDSTLLMVSLAVSGVLSVVGLLLVGVLDARFVRRPLAAAC